MKVVYTEPALADLDEIRTYLQSNYPNTAGPAERRIRSVVARIGKWPQSAQLIAERSGVHVVPLVRYPYKIFYRITGEAVEILHIRHAARRPWEGE